ncbi:DegV family protein [Athalassotoga sp.]|uniref:DegV family protein n=1 Tax=Athalassotoga sp. TaxID=2022597 RepID=UPI003CFBCF46
MNEKISIIADTGCDLDERFIYDHNVKLIPFRIISDDGHEYRDRFDISAQDVVKLLENHDLKTSLPAIEDITKVFDKVKSEGYDHVIVITISSKLSGTFSTINMIAKNYKELKISVVDSLTLSMAEGFLVMDACEMAESGVDFDDIVKKIEIKRSSVKAYFVLDTLKHLKKSGRMPEAAFRLSEILNIKPIFTIKEGYISLESVSLGKKHALKVLEKKLDPNATKCAVAYTGSKNEAELFAKRFSKDITIYYLGPALSLHGGKGIVGLIYAKETS